MFKNQKSGAESLDGENLKKPLRILSVGHSYVVGLNRGILREIAKDSNFDVTVVGPSFFKGSLRDLPFEKEPSGSPLKVKTIPAYLTHRMHIFAYDHFALKKIFQEKYDILHVWEEPYIFAGYQIARLAAKSKIPFCVRTAQSLIKKYPFPFSKFEKRVFGWCGGWIAGGQLVFKAMEEKGWNQQEKGSILSLAVDTDHFTPFTLEQKIAKQKKLGLKGPLLGFLGRLEEEKGLDLLMKALGSIKDQSWSILFMGSGSYKEKLESWAKNQGLEDRVAVRLFPHNQVADFLPACDLLLCPSQTRPFWKEQFGRMIVEGFAAGVPILASDSGEIPRVVGEAGGVLSETDTQVWADTIRQLINDPQKLKDWREKGLERAEQFSSRTLGNKYKEYYQKLSLQKV